MSGRQSRVARKAARVVQSDLDREFNSGIAELKRARQKALDEAGATYRKGHEALLADRQKARADAEKEYESGRDALLKTLAPKAEVAA